MSSPSALPDCHFCAQQLPSHKQTNKINSSTSTLPNNFMTQWLTRTNNYLLNPTWQCPAPREAALAIGRRPVWGGNAASGAAEV